MRARRPRSNGVPTKLIQTLSDWYVPPLRDQKSPLTPRRIYDPQGTQGYVTDRHEYQPTDPLSLRERVGVRVKSSNTYPSQQAEGGGEGDWSGPDHDATALSPEPVSSIPPNTCDQQPRLETGAHTPSRVCPCYGC